MRTEKEKMLNGQLYDASDPVLVAERQRARRLARLFNQTLETDGDRPSQLLSELLGIAGPGCYIEPTLRCDYGYNTEVSKPGVPMGNNVTVAAGAVVPKDLADNVVVGGNPARVIRKLA